MTPYLMLLSPFAARAAVSGKTLAGPHPLSSFFKVGPLLVPVLILTLCLIVIIVFMSLSASFRPWVWGQYDPKRTMKSISPWDNALASLKWTLLSALVFPIGAIFAFLLEKRILEAKSKPGHHKQGRRALVFLYVVCSIVMSIVIGTSIVIGIALPMLHRLPHRLP